MPLLFRSAHSPSRSATVRRFGKLVAGLLLTNSVAAAPHVPLSDETVLERVPAAADTQRLEPLRARLAQQTNDVASATALAQGYLDIGRANGDPRFVSYAQATLAPWLTKPRADARVLVIAATASQFLHNFDEALALLDRALAEHPHNGQAWLTKATILQVQGRFAEAREACRPLVRASGQLIALACLTGVDSLNGQLERSYAALRSVYVDDPRLPVQVRTWILGQLADMALRSGDERAAEAYVVAGLRAAPQDPYLKGQYADLLLLKRQYDRVVQLLKADTLQDNLLLRLAIAGWNLHSAAGRDWSNAFQARYEAARRAHDYTHLREQARFLLEVRGDSTQALQLAKENWSVQREPADVRVYLAAAALARDPDAALPVQSWIREMRYEDRTLGTGRLITTHP